VKQQELVSSAMGAILLSQNGRHSCKATQWSSASSVIKHFYSIHGRGTARVAVQMCGCTPVVGNLSQTRYIPPSTSFGLLPITKLVTQQLGVSCTQGIKFNPDCQLPFARRYFNLYPVTSNRTRQCLCLQCFMVPLYRSLSYAA